MRSILTGTGITVTDGKVAITKPRVNLKAAIDSLTASPASSVNLLLLDADGTTNSESGTTHP